MRIVADRNIAYVEQAFAQLGEVRTLPSSDLSPAALRDADVLLVRSTVKVGPALLEESRVRFVATATIGTDHLDLPWLRARGIPVASAPGSNADSVLQWWAAALLTVAERRQLAPFSPTVGIVGVGAVGGRIERFCRALGWTVLLCDPPRARREGPAGFVALDELLPLADVVTVHVPLERNGEDATHHLLDARRLWRLKPSALFMNASRGEVVDCAALEAALAEQRLAGALLDVFEGEPAPAQSLVRACDLATPHIAGHSLDGKAAGTEMIYDAACRVFGAAKSWRAADALPPPPISTLAIEATSASQAVLAAVRAFYRIEEDDRSLRRIANHSDSAEVAAAFRRFRQSYPVRRELRGLRVALAPGLPEAARALATLGASSAQ